MGNSMQHSLLCVFVEYQLHKKHSNVVAQEEIIIVQSCFWNEQQINLYVTSDKIWKLYVSVSYI